MTGPPRGKPWAWMAIATSAANTSSLSCTVCQRWIYATMPPKQLPPLQAVQQGIPTSPSKPRLTSSALPQHLPPSKTNRSSEAGSMYVACAFSTRFAASPSTEIHLSSPASIWMPRTWPFSSSTTLVLKCCDPGTDPFFQPAQGADPKRGPCFDQKPAPQNVSPQNWETCFGGSKSACKSGPRFGAVNPRLSVKNHSSVFLRVTTKPRAQSS